ncbi:MAG: alpha/beta hydrolase [Cyanobacteria bacterium RU_5_0]|nr:alpha/beta hydrolase [Cyanobacteria bacterium RU_5_0]
MSILPDALWLNVSPSLRRFDRPLLHYLSQQMMIAQWEYSQTQDEACSLEIALVLLHDYLKSCDRPIHLIGHSMSGLLGLLYARRYPKRVRSLTLLSVGIHPAIDWQAFYYAHRQLLPCSRQMILARMVDNLFGDQFHPIAQGLLRTLERDLETSLSPHTLFRRESIAPGGAAAPLFVCSGEDDMIVSPHELQGWQSWLKKGDRLWKCPQGRYFFHYFQPKQVGQQIVDFYASLLPETTEQTTLEPLGASS